MKVRIKTYEIQPQLLDDKLIACFSHKKNTPLPIISVNGIMATSEHPSIPTAFFPNPDTQNMLFEIRHHIQPITTLSSKIVVYLSKNQKPVLYLFPDGSTRAMVDNPENEMNNCMRRNLQYQIQLRKKMIAKAKQRRR